MSSPKRTHSAIEIQTQRVMDIFEAWSQVREYMDHEAGKLRRLAKISPVKPMEVSWTTTRPSSNGKRKEPEAEAETSEDEEEEVEEEEEEPEKKKKKKKSTKTNKKKKVDGPKRLTAHNVFMSQFMADPEKKRSKEEKSFQAASAMWNSIKGDPAKVAVYKEQADKQNAEALEKWTEAKATAAPVVVAAPVATVAAPPPPASSASSESDSGSSGEEEEEEEEEKPKTRRAMQVVDDEASD